MFSSLVDEGDGVTVIDGAKDTDGHNRKPERSKLIDLDDGNLISATENWL